MAIWTVTTEEGCKPTYSPFGFTLGLLEDSEVTIATSTKMKLVGDNAGDYMTFKGKNFTYSVTSGGDYTVTGGTVTSFVLGNYMTVTGLSVSAKKVNSYVNADDTEGFISYILSGDDTIYGNSGEDALTGEDGNDTIYGYVGNDSLYGGAGTDKLYGGSGNDKLKGDSGADKLRGESGKDKLSGGTGTDKLYGGSDNDKLYGGADNDKLYGESGNDALYGEQGNDYLAGGSGSDKLKGGAGKDTFYYNSINEGGDTIVDFSHSDNDKIYLKQKAFNKLAKGKLNSKYFVSNNAGNAKDRNDYFCYSKKNNALYYDSNGKASGGKKLIATFSNGVTLKNTDIVIA